MYPHRLTGFPDKSHGHRVCPSLNPTHTLRACLSSASSCIYTRVLHSALPLRCRFSSSVAGSSSRGFIQQEKKKKRHGRMLGRALGPLNIPYKQQQYLRSSCLGPTDHPDAVPLCSSKRPVPGSSRDRSILPRSLQKMSFDINPLAFSQVSFSCLF